MVAALSIGAAADDSLEVRRAAALLDYVQRDYGTCVKDGAVVNAAEYAEQQGFAQDAADAMGKLSVAAPLVADARELTALVARKAPAPEVSARAGALHDGLLKAAGLSTAPPADLREAREVYAQSCAACHGIDGRGDGFAARDLPTKPTDFTGPERAQLTPYRVYSAITWGVPHTAMPEFQTTLGERRRWDLAVTVLEFGHSQEQALRGEELARARNLDGAALTPLSDEELRQKLGSDDLVAWVRRIAPFAGPPPAGFPELRTQVALAAVNYTHRGPDDAAARLREAQLGVWRRLEPLAVRPRIAAVREAFAAARHIVAARETSQRVLYAVAQLDAQIARAGPERAPDDAALAREGAFAALRFGFAAALAAAAAHQRKSALLALAGAAIGAVAASRFGWPWWLTPALLATASPLVLASAPAAALLSSSAAAGEAAASWAAARAVFPDLHAAFVWGAVAAGAALLAAGWLAPRNPRIRWAAATGLLAAAWLARPW